MVVNIRLLNYERVCSIMLCLLLLLIISFNPTFAQVELRLNGKERSENQVVLSVGNSISMKYSESPVIHTQWESRMKTLTGKILSITDSSIAIKKLFSREIVKVPFTHIYKVKKQSVGESAVTLIVPVTLWIINLSLTPISPLLIAVSIFPSAIIANSLFSKNRIRRPFNYEIVK
jgi:hypothetical protein